MFTPKSPYAHRVPFRRMERMKSANLYPYCREIEAVSDNWVVIDGKPVLMFGSNSYLGLQNHPRILQAMQEALARYGAGCTGSRFLNGSLDLHRQLEEELASFLGKEAALVFTTGFQVNSGVIPALVGRKDHLFIDERVHASIIDGCRLSFAKVHKFRHNDAADLERKLALWAEDTGLKVIIVDGLYSMEGNLADLPAITRTARRHGAFLMVDDAHGLGVLGPQGQGAAAHFGLTHEVDFIGGTFSKSLAGVGGYFAADRTTIDYLRHSARTFMFSASLPPALTAGALAALALVREDEARRHHLWRNIRHAVAGLEAAGFEVGKPGGAVIPVYLHDEVTALTLTRQLFEQGIFVNPVLPPAVAPGHAIIRFSVTATHQLAEIDLAIHTLSECCRAQELAIKPANQPLAKPLVA